jgi:hypothetical protein
VNLRRSLQERRVPIAVTVVTLAITWWIHIRTLAITGGSASYPVDDAFIHLAIAKNLAFSGTYGVTAGEFTSASSSVAWPYLLAALMRLVGNNAWLALYLNLAIGACVPFTLDSLMKAVDPRSLHRAQDPRPGTWDHVIVLSAALFLGPLPTLMSVGMEHTLHALLVLLFLREMLRGEHGSTRLLVLALLCTLVRYESLIMVGLVALRLVRTKQWRNAGLLGAAGILPVCLFGAFLRAHGHPWLPLSVVLKGLHIENAGALLGALLPLGKLQDNWPTALVGAAGLCAYTCARIREDGPAQAVLGLLLGMLTAQCIFGQLGWFYRYDAYLVMPLTLCSMVVLMRHAHGAFERSVRIIGAVLLLCAAPRGLYAMRTTAEAAGNIYMQQVQTARFLAANFPHERVLVNDIGAVSYYRHGPMTDLMGLANREVAQARGWRIDRPLPVAALTRFSEQADVAVMYEPWFQGAIPPAWTKVATWTIPNNRVCAFATVAVYATRMGAVPRVRSAVGAFAPLLPPGISLSDSAPQPEAHPP